MVVVCDATLREDVMWKLLCSISRAIKRVPVVLLGANECFDMVRKVNVAMELVG